MNKHIFGIDVGGTTVKMGLFQADGELLDKWEIKSRTEASRDTETHMILQDIAASIEAKMQERGISKEDVIGIGIGIPGPALDDGTVINPPNLGWGIFNVREELAGYTGIEHIVVSNDANIAALGELWKGGGRGFQSIVMITLGTGIGGGVIIRGRILNGATGAGGEIGHIKVKEGETRACGCGRYGCLETYAGAAGIVRGAQKVLEESDEPSVLRGVEPLTTREIFDGAKAGDALALKAVEAFGDVMGLACANIATVMNPEAFVIGGGVSKAGPMILDLIQKHFTHRVMTAVTDTRFCMAELGNDAGIYGAAKMVME